MLYTGINEGWEEVAVVGDMHMDWRYLGIIHRSNVLSSCTAAVNRSAAHSKALSLTGHGGANSSETSRLPYFLDNRLTDGGELSVLSAGRHLEGFLVLISVRSWVDPRAIVRLEG
jgi:hypothetical protein